MRKLSPAQVGALQHMKRCWVECSTFYHTHHAADQRCPTVKVLVRLGLCVEVPADLAQHMVYPTFRLTEAGTTYLETHGKP